MGEITGAIAGAKSYRESGWIDNCEIRENNYYEEKNDERLSKIQAIDALYNPNENYKQNYIEQTAIIYNYDIGYKKIKMTSQSFPFSTGILINYIENKSIMLYFNKLDETDYAFEIIHQQECVHHCA